MPKKGFFNNQAIAVPRFTDANGFKTTGTRSALMSKIRSKDNKYELMLRKRLWALGLRYRKHDKRFPGNPDIVFKRLKVVIFIDGEFWHGYNWPIKKEKIAANRGYWIPKIERNMQRDLENNNALESLGFTVIRFWEHDIKKDINKCLNIVSSFLKDQENNNLNSHD